MCMDDLEDAVRKTKGSFLVGGKRVWMSEKPEFFDKLDKKLRRDYDIGDNYRYIVSFFINKGELWPVNFESKMGNFESTILISTDFVDDLGNKCKLGPMQSSLFYPKNVIYNFKVSGCLLMFDYIKHQYVSSREEIEEAEKALMG